MGKGAWRWLCSDKLQMGGLPRSVLGKTGSGFDVSARA